MVSFPPPAVPRGHFEFMLFEEVENTEDVRLKLKAGELDMAVVNPCMVLSLLQLRAAGYKALTFHEQERMVTNNIHSELVYSLSASRNISQSLSAFGPKPDSTAMLIAVYCTPDTDICAVKENVAKVIRGKHVSLSNFENHTNHREIIKVYKIKDAEL
eukprot:Sspe_Gene.113728::Locus_98463_Transcript_1_1_Confidence_1.000_Length_511::g.113728::m.113728/K15901/CGI121, TPRKB; EKC/KEOPS complex subunit CGI121/TPRKB